MTGLTQLTDPLNGATVQNLLEYDGFTAALVSKLQDNFAKLDGSNATDAGVTAMLGKLQGQDKVVTTKELDAKNFATTTQLNDKVDKTSTDTFVKLDGSNINVVPFSTKLTTEGTSAIKTALTNLANKDGSDIDIGPISTKLESKFATTAQLAGKADSTALTNFANKDGSDIDIGPISTKLESKFATTAQLAGKADSTALTNLANKDGSDIDIGPISTKLASKFAKLDGTNADQGAELLNAILNVKSSTDPNTTILAERLAVVKPGTFVASDYARLDGTNITNSHEKGQAFAKAIFSVKDTTGGKTILENQLADKFVAIGSGGKAADIDPADTLPDAWANLI